MNKADFAQITEAVSGSADGSKAASIIRFGNAAPGFLREQIEALADRSAAYRDGYLRALEKALSRP